MERLIARLAVLLLSATLHATPTPEHRERYQRTGIMYKWISVVEWRYDALENAERAYNVQVLVEDYRNYGYKWMPKELPRGKEGER